MKSPVQSLSDSDQTEGTLSPALVPQFRRIPAPNSEKNQDFMDHLMIMMSYWKLMFLTYCVIVTRKAELF